MNLVLGELGQEFVAELAESFLFLFIVQMKFTSDLTNVLDYPFLVLFREDFIFHTFTVGLEEVDVINLVGANEVHEGDALSLISLIRCPLFFWIEKSLDLELACLCPNCLGFNNYITELVQIVAQRRQQLRMRFHGNDNLRVFLCSTIRERTDRRTNIQNYIILLYREESLIQISVAEHFTVEHSEEPVVLIDQPILE